MCCIRVIKSWVFSDHELCHVSFMKGRDHMRWGPSLPGTNSGAAEVILYESFYISPLAHNFGSAVAVHRQLR